MARTKGSSGARGGVITIASQGLKLLLQVLSVSLLSRLLEPEDFGLLAMTTVFIQLGSLLRDFGLPMAAIQARKLSQQQASNLFWLNSGLGLIGASLLIVVTPLISDFYNEPRLEALLPVLAFTVLLGGVSAQGRVQLARSFRFGALAFVDVASQALGIAVAVLCALAGWGYWALAWQNVAMAVAILSLQAILTKWVPLLPARGSDTGALVKSGVDFAGTGILNFLASNADTMSIGSRWGATPLGNYNRAFQLLSLPIQGMMVPLTNVVVPVANRARERGQTIDSVLLRVQFALGTATIWVYLVAFVSAEHSIPILLGQGWDSTIVLFQILAIGGVFHPLSFVSYWGFILHQRSRALLHYNIVTKLLGILLVVLASFHSVEMVAYAYATSLAVSWPINLVWLARTAGQDSWAYFRNGAKILTAAVSAALTTRWLSQVAGVSAFGHFGGVLATASTATVIFLVVLLALPGGWREIKQCTNLLHSLRGKHHSKLGEIPTDS